MSNSIIAQTPIARFSQAYPTVVESPWFQWALENFLEDYMDALFVTDTQNEPVHSISAYRQLRKSSEKSSLDQLFYETSQNSLRTNS